MEQGTENVGSLERRTTPFADGDDDLKDEVTRWQIDRVSLQQPDLTTTSTKGDREGSCHRQQHHELREWGNWMDSSVATPPILSPTTPPRVLSSHSLLGEHIMSSSRQPCDEFGAAMLVPHQPTTPQQTNLCDDETTTTPTSSLPQYPQLSPPPLFIASQNNSNANLSTLEIVATSSASVASKGTHKGRPPRAPPQQSSGLLLSAAQRGNKSFSHSRVPSFSDCSLLSALTDGSTSDNEQQQLHPQHTAPPMMKPSFHHQKAHSWDFNMTWLEGINQSSSNSAPISILQPILNDEEDEEEAEEHDPRNLSFSPEKTEVMSPIRIRNEPAYFEPTRLSASDPRTKLSTSTPTTFLHATKHLRLADVVQSFPIEMDAETRLLHEIETLCKKNHRIWKESTFFKFLARLPPTAIDYAFSRGCLHRRSEENLDGSASTNPTAATTTTHGTGEMKGPTHNPPALSWELDNERSPIPQDAESQNFIATLKRLHETLFAISKTEDFYFPIGLSRQRWRVDLAFVVIPMLTAVLLVNRPEVAKTRDTSDSTSSHSLLLTLTLAFGFAKVAAFALRLILLIQTFSTSFGLALLLSQSNGWPALAFFWGFFAIVFLVRTNDIALHWPPFVTVSNEAKALCIISVFAIFFGVVVSLKRALTGLYVGKSLVACYSPPLKQLLQNMMLISELAVWSKEKESLSNTSASTERRCFDFYGKSDLNSPSINDIVAPPKPRKGSWDATVGDPRQMSLQRRFLERESGERIDRSERAASRSGEHAAYSTKKMVMDLVEGWEEPESPAGVSFEKLNSAVHTMLCFQQSLEVIHTDFPFSPAFGNAQTRENCAESAQHVFRRIAKHHDTVQFVDAISSLTSINGGELDRGKAMQVIQLLRPDRQGRLSKSEFVKSIDSVYISLRRLQASYGNRSIILDRCDNILSGVLYSFLGGLLCFAAVPNASQLCLFCAGFGIWLSLCFTGIISSWIEGVLWIVARQPFELGDRIVISNVTSMEYPANATWIVERFDLFTTTLRHSASNEVTTVTNHALAHTRIVNKTQSKNATVHVKLHLSLGFAGASNKLERFQLDVDDYVRSRPREWMSLKGLRFTRVLAELGREEYTLTAQHRASWHHAEAIQQSTAELHGFCFELQSKMDQRFKLSPPPAITVSG